MYHEQNGSRDPVSHRTKEIKHIIYYSGQNNDSLIMVLEMSVF